MQKANYFKYIVAVLAAAVFISIFFTGGGISAYAAVSGGEYSNVLDDLQKDTSFSNEYYPVKADDYSLSLIQIAESVNNELFLYVYQPSGQATGLVASSVNISTTINDDISYHNYKLQLLNSFETLYKYLVKDFTVRSDETRYYCFTSIYRPYDSSLGDKQPSGDNYITEVDYPINKQYCFSVINGKPYCSVVETEAITVTDKFVGFARYSDGGYVWGNASCDNHFVAFNTDKPIDRLVEADVYYVTQDYWSSSWMGGGRTDYGEKESNYAYLKGEKVVHSGGGFWAGTYEWETIQTVDRFLEVTGQGQIYSGVLFDVNCGTPIKESALEELRGKTWVLRFAETADNFYANSGTTSEHRTLVGEVTILRLKFETDGVVYNLGVIDNKQTGSDEPITDNDNEHFSIQPKAPNCEGGSCAGGSWLLLIIAVIVIILLIIFFPSLLTLLGYIVKAVIWLATLPFKAIEALINKIKETREKRKAEKVAAEQPETTAPETAKTTKQKPKTNKKQNKK